MTGARPSRRALLASLGLAGGAAAGAGVAVAATSGDDDPVRAAASAPQDAVGRATVPFHGPHQAGIATPARAHVALLGLDLRRGTDRDGVVRLLRLLSDDAARLTQGRPALADPTPRLAAVPAGLTVTFGFGAGLFTAAGLDAERPSSLRPLETFPGDRLEDRWSDGDLLVHLEADDQATVSHALRMVTLDARRSATVRWLQRGFRPAAGSLPSGTTMRNLMDQVDGTVNPVPGTDDFDRVVRSAGRASGDPAWFAGGSMLVLRRIRMDLDAWDAFDAAGKETVMGRRLADGSPLTGTRESDVPDLDAVDALGFPVIDDTAHVRLARAASPAERMLRRGANYDEGPDAEGRPDAGLLFAGYQADVDRTFVPVQRRLAASDAMNRWLTHVGSAVFAVPPGCAEGGFVGDGLLTG